MSWILRRASWSVLLSLLSVMIVAAQGTCEGLLEDALFAVEDSCQSMGRNEACYGYQQVEASFLVDVDDDYFTQPADISMIAELETIRTAPLNLNNDTWGVAVMNVQANLPNTLPGQSVTFMLLGDVEVENTVDPESAFQPSDGIELRVSSSAGANIRSGAGLNFNVVGGARFDDILLTDGVSEDGEWFRVIYRERPAWISRIVIDDTAEDIADLPTLTSDLQTPMQSFYLSTGIGEPACETVPDNILLVQGPENIEVNINANGADITIGSTLGLRIIEIDGENFLEAIAFAGEIDFKGQIIRPGRRSIACLDEDFTVSCDASPPEAINGFGGEWCVIEDLPSSLLNYDVDILCPGEAPPVVPTSAPVVNTDTTATEEVTEVETVDNNSSLIEGVDCSTFSLIAPLYPVDAGSHAFSWQGVQGPEITYQLVFYNYEGLEVESFFTPETIRDINLGSDTSTGGEFSWEVRAYQNGAYACVSNRSPVLSRNVIVEQPPNDEGAPPQFTASIASCGAPLGAASYNATVNWSGAIDGVSIDWTDDSGVGGNIYDGAEAGSVSFSSSYFVYTFQSITATSAGIVINLGAC